MIPKSWTHNSLQKAVPALLSLGAILLTAFSILSFSSIHNSDDSIYAEVMREVAEGRVWPLTFSGNPFHAKPPLFFWGGGSLVALLGNFDTVYRLLPAAFYLFMLWGAFVWVSRVFRKFAAILCVLAILGSPILVEFSNRAMLDIPIAALGLCLLFIAGGSQRPRWLLTFGLGAVGWWIKELAILPFLLTAVLVQSVRFPSRRPTRESLAGISLFIVSILALRFLRSSAGVSVLPTAISSLHSFSPNQPAASIYFDLLLADSPILWLLPLALVIIFKSARGGERALALSLCAGVTAQVAAVLSTKSILPHYLLPAIAPALVLVAIALSRIQKHSARVAVVLLCLFQIARAYSEMDRHPADATKTLALVSREMLPSTSPLCLIDTYLPGFRFYSQRPTRAFYTNPQGYASQARVDEFSGWVEEISVSQVPNTLKTRCGGIGILPTALAVQLLEIQPLDEEGPLTLAQFRKN